LAGGAALGKIDPLILSQSRVTLSLAVLLRCYWLEGERLRCAFRGVIWRGCYC